MKARYMYTTSQLNAWKTTWRAGKSTWRAGKSTGLQILGHATVDFRTSLYLFIDVGKV